MEAPSIHLIAPVKSGSSNNTLSIAVGHDNSTNWPSPGKPSIFLAHDVSWFANIDNLTTGNTILWTEPCSTIIYKVVRHMVRQPGQPIPSYPGGDIVLVTCYPTNALWFTPDRYVVIGQYLKTVHTGSASSKPPTTGPDATTQSVSPASALHSTQLPFLALPAGLASTGITLQDNEVLLGHLHIDGAPTASLKQSPVPLDVSNRGLELYFAAMHAAAQYNNHPVWWNDIAPQVANHSPWTNAGPLNITEHVDSSTITGLTLCSPNKTVNETVTSQMLVVSSVGPGCS
ncbi:MAG: sortase domain-containing protein [Acidimicrobiales bacterium]